MSETIIRKLDTSKMDAAIRAFDEGIKEYNSIRTAVERATTELFLDWTGKGRKAFEKDYETIYVQLKDIEDILYELYHALADGLAAYITTDEGIGKQLMQ